MAEDTVMLKVEVSGIFRSRLKSQAARVGKTMGELLEELTECSLRELELENAGLGSPAKGEAK
jgi:hypothetical protein